LSNSALGQEVKDWVVSILIALVLAFFIRYFIVELYMVEGPSMRPTLVNSERLVVNKFIYHFKQPERGDVLVFRYPRDPSRDFIKRVIAVAGDTIELKDGRLFLNGQLLMKHIYWKRPGDLILWRLFRKELFLLWVITGITQKTAGSGMLVLCR